MDPAFAKSQNNIWVVNHIYNQLVDLNDSMQIVPELARKWEILENGKLYRFYLRNDVYFHPDNCFGSLKTRKLKSEDVKFSFERLIDKSLNAPGSWIFANRVDSLNSFQCIGDSIIEIRLKNPFAPFLHILTNAYCSVYPPEVVKAYQTEFSKHPIGTGHFKLSKWLGRKGIFLSKFDSCFLSQQYLNGIRISFMEDRNTAYLEFLTGGIDFFSGLASGFAHEIFQSNGELFPDYKNKFNFLKGDYLNTEYIGINFTSLSKDHPLRQRVFRQALNYAVDRTKMLQKLRFNMGTPATSGFIPKGLPAFDPTLNLGYSYDPIKARELLKTIHYDPSNPLHRVELSTNKDYVDLITFVAKQWEEVGISVSIDLVETATLREKMKNGAVSLFRASWIADYPDEESFLTVFYGPNPSPPNYTRFDNSEYNQLYEMAIKELDPKKRIVLYQQLDKLLIHECPVVFLFYDQTAWFVQKNIKGLKPNPLNALNLAGVEE